MGSDNTVEAVVASGGDVYYSGMSDHFFQVVFVATACSIISGAVAERMKLWAFLAFAVVMTGFISFSRRFDMVPAKIGVIVIALKIRAPVIIC